MEKQKNGTKSYHSYHSADQFFLKNRDQSITQNKHFQIRYEIIQDEDFVLKDRLVRFCDETAQCDCSREKGTVKDNDVKLTSMS